MADENEKRVLSRGNYLQLVAKDRWEWVERVNCTGVVMIVAKTPENKVVLVEQFRIPVGLSVVEFPAGLVNDREGDDEDLETAARRELLEETGFEAGALERVGEGPPSAGMSPELITIFLAKDLRKVSAGGGDETESITVHEVPSGEIDAWLEAKQSAGSLIDPKVFAGLYFLNRP
ncbi:MAG: NUDIX hydrolase [Deltaproteobacteria bacterium]|nr:NUDIX hydrolase [Deltaproteobacteria bacterium]